MTYRTGIEFVEPSDRVRSGDLGVPGDAASQPAGSLAAQRRGQKACSCLLLLAACCQLPAHLAFKYSR